jgi:predicted nucleic acid-binding protein
VAVLFDTDAISEVLRRRPSERYVRPYDVDVARAYGALRAQLEETGQTLADADVLIAATAVHHDLELVTGNLRHFRRISGLRFNTILEEARRG